MHQDRHSIPELADGIGNTVDALSSGPAGLQRWNVEGSRIPLDLCTILDLIRPLDLCEGCWVTMDTTISSCSHDEIPAMRL